MLPVPLCHSEGPKCDQPDSYPTRCRAVGAPKNLFCQGAWNLCLLSQVHGQGPRFQFIHQSMRTFSRPSPSSSLRPLTSQIIWKLSLMLSSLPHHNSEFIPATAQPFHSRGQGKPLRLFSSLLWEERLGCSSRQGKLFSPPGWTSQPPAGTPGLGLGCAQLVPRKGLFRGSSLFLGTKPLGWKIQEAGQFYAPMQIALSSQPLLTPVSS